MAEYIDREKVLQAFSNFVWDSNHSDLVPAPTWNHAVDIVRDMEAEDAKPVVHGEWVKHKDSRVGWYCSVCQNSDLYAYLWNPETDIEYTLQDNFCPNCGADMRGENE